MYVTKMVLMSISYCSPEDFIKHIKHELKEVPYVYIDLHTMKRQKIETFKVDGNNEIIQQLEETSYSTGNVICRTYNQIVKNIKKDPYNEFTTTMTYKDFSEILSE